MYHVECIDIHKEDMMYLYFDRSCLCANNMYNTANFHIRNLMTGLKKDPSLCTENEKSVMRTFGRAIPVINFSHRIKHFEKIYRICQDLPPTGFLMPCSGIQTMRIIGPSIPMSCRMP